MILNKSNKSSFGYIYYDRGLITADDLISFSISSQVLFRHTAFVCNRRNMPDSLQAELRNSYDMSPERAMGPMFSIKPSSNTSFFHKSCLMKKKSRRPLKRRVRICMQSVAFISNIQHTWKQLIKEKRIRMKAEFPRLI